MSTKSLLFPQSSYCVKLAGPWFGKHLAPILIPPRRKMDLEAEVLPFYSPLTVYLTKSYSIIDELSAIKNTVPSRSPNLSCC